MLPPLSALHHALPAHRMLPHEGWSTGSIFPNRGSHGLEPRHFTIAELLKSSGYKPLQLASGISETNQAPHQSGLRYFYGVPHSNDMYPAENMKYAKDCLYLEGMSQETIKAFADAKPGHQPAQGQGSPDA